jgi:excisionase family DNA binding protein
MRHRPLETEMAPMDTTDRITAPIGEFCKLAGIGRSLVYEMIGDGRLDSILIGKRRLIVLDSYRRLVERQRASTPPPGSKGKDRTAARR